MTYLYHLYAHDFQGTMLYPLNGLRDRFPNLYEREKKKYAGRESVLEYIVPGLNRAWADTVNLSALDPRHLVAERQKLGIPCLHREYLLRQKERGELALGFVFVPHVLVGAPIDIAGLELTDL